MIQSGLVESAHDVSDGGLAVALAECAFSSYRRDAVGVKTSLEGDISAAAHLFGETQSRIVLSLAEENLDRLMEIAREAGVPVTLIGRTGGDRLEIAVNGETVIDRSIEEIQSAWRNTLPSLFALSVRESE
jgi:phosphoribosylformylglycinamidine synthase